MDTHVAATNECTAAFRSAAGLIRTEPAEWSEPFAPALHGRAGS